jgi:hypothetical protein
MTIDAEQLHAAVSEPAEIEIQEGRVTTRRQSCGTKVCAQVSIYKEGASKWKSPSAKPLVALVPGGIGAEMLKAWQRISFHNVFSRGQHPAQHSYSPPFYCHAPSKIVLSAPYRQPYHPQHHLP